MDVPRSVRVILNGRSGAGDLTPDALCTLFAQHGCSCAVTLLSPDVDLAQLAATDPEEMAWVAAGGDGTVNAVAGCVAGTSRCMGVLPAGTLNHFARDLGMPATMEDAVRVIATSDPREVDAAEINGKIFVNNSSLGVYPAMVFDRDRILKRGGWKWGAMILASARAFVRFRCLQVDLLVKGERVQCTTPLLFVGNNVYCVEGLSMGSRAHLDQGRLSIFLAPNIHRAGMLRALASALFGRVRGSAELTEYEVEGFTVNVRGRHRLRVSLDGEVQRIPSPLSYAIRPNALRVLAPAVVTTATE